MRLFHVFIPKSVVAVIFADVILLFACLVFASYLTIGDGFEIYILHEDGLRNILIALVTLLIGLYFQNLYTELDVRSRLLLFQQVALTIGTMFVVQALVAYIDPGFMLSRWLLMYSSLFILALYPAWRIVYARSVFARFGKGGVLFLGTNPVAIEIAQRISERREIGLNGIGFVDDDHPCGSIVAGLPILGPKDSLRAIVGQTRPQSIVICLVERRGTMPYTELLDLRFSGIRIEDGTRMFESLFGRVLVRHLRPSELIFATDLGPAAWMIRFQTVYSFLIALAGAIVTLPLMAIVALAVRLSSRGPILFRQTRVGLHGKPFTVYKFRSMVVDAEAKTGAVWATKNDPRVTRVGGFLRKTRLDELPQLWNVLRGHMAIVGPRPERPEFVKVLSEQIPFYRQRHVVKPGVTGWAQINYKYGESFEDTVIKLEHDLYYIKNISPMLDAYIIFHTLKVMLFSSHGQ